MHGQTDNFNPYHLFKSAVISLPVEGHAMYVVHSVLRSPNSFLSGMEEGTNVKDDVAVL